MSVSLKIQTSSFHSFSHHIAPFPGSALSLPQQIVTAPSLLLLRSQTRAWDSWTRWFGAVNSPQAGGQRSMKPVELPDLWAKLQKDVSENSPLASRASGNLGWTSSTPGAHSIHLSILAVAREVRQVIYYVKVSLSEILKSKLSVSVIKYSTVRMSVCFLKLCMLSKSKRNDKNTKPFTTCPSVRWRDFRLNLKTNERNPEIQNNVEINLNNISNISLRLCRKWCMCNHAEI